MSLAEQIELGFAAVAVEFNRKKSGEILHRADSDAYIAGVNQTTNATAQDLPGLIVSFELDDGQSAEIDGLAACLWASAAATAALLITDEQNNVKSINYAAHSAANLFAPLPIIEPGIVYGPGVFIRKMRLRRNGGTSQTWANGLNVGNVDDPISFLKATLL